MSADLQRLLDAESWQLELQYTFDASTASQWPGTENDHPGSEQSLLHSEYRETIPLTVRSQGASLSMQWLSGQMTSDPAAAQEKLMAIIDQTDSIASWMTGGLDVPSDGDLQKMLEAGAAQLNKPIGSMKFDFKSRTHLEDLYNEVGDHFNRDVSIAARGEVPVVLDSQQITFELNAAGKRVLLTLPAVLPPPDDATVDREEVTTYIPLPLGPKPVAERKTDKIRAMPDRLELTEPAVTFGSGILIFDDPLTLAGGRISGQHTTTATYSTAAGSDPVPGKLAVKYVLTPR